MDRTLNQIILAIFILEFHFGILDDQIPNFSVLFRKHLSSDAKFTFEKKVN